MNWLLYFFLQAVQESTLLSLKELLSDPAIGNNPILRLIAGTIFMHEQDYNEALKHTNAGGTMELWVLFCFLDNEKHLNLLQSCLNTCPV